MSASSVLASVWIDRCFAHGLATIEDDDEQKLEKLEGQSERHHDKITAPASPAAVTTPGLIITANLNSNAHSLPLSFSESTMSSVRNHRILIASLFLPTTAVLGPDNSQSATPTTTAPRPLPAARLLSQTAVSRSGTPLKPHPGHIGPFKSIVDDLRDKSKAPSPVVTPNEKPVNPFFTSLTAALAATADALPIPSVLSPKRSPSYSDHPPVTQPRNSRIARRKSSSRSSSRRPTADWAAPNGPGTGSDVYHIEFNSHANGGLVNAVNSVSDRMRKKLWVGTLGNPTDDFDDDTRKSVEKRMRVEHDSLPVWIPDAEFSKCYDEFCHQVLWPCLHYAIPDAPKTKSFYESESWAQYSAVNQKFADAIIANYQDGDIIWVNDYHLLLVPSLVRAALPSAAIGFFLHVAFPSSEIFRCLSVRQQLLQGVLAADLIGFQTANFARHFRQTVSRILSLEALPKGIQTHDRFVDVAVFPMGIDVGRLDLKRREPEVSEWVRVLKARYAGMKMIVARDKLDEVQGVRHKLCAFEMFLEKYPQFREKVVLIQIALSTSEENETQGAVGDVVARINSRFATLTYQPVVFLHTSEVSFGQYLALLTAADAFLVTSLREGMALRTHEYVICQEGKARPLILSEFTGSYSYSGFRSCLPINPWDTRGTAQAIHQALTMSDEEAFSRWQDLHDHVVTQTAQAFVTSFLTRCLRVHLEHQNQVEAELSPISTPSLTTSPSKDYMTAPRRRRPTLDVARIMPRYRHSMHRLILVDLEGTLWHDFDPRAFVETGKFNVPKDALDVLNKLAEDERNEVWLLSGLSVPGALDKIVEEIPKVGICAENGCFIKPRPVGNRPQPWVNMVVNFNLSWKPSCLEILTYFTERTPGSFIEEREASVVWRFWTGKSDDGSGLEWARRQAAEAQNHIFDSLGERYGLRIIPGKHSFIVLPNNVSRSSAVGSIISHGGPAQYAALRPAWLAASLADTETDLETDIDFVLAVSGDEKLLRRLNELDSAETVSTGEGGTDARWKLVPERTVETLGVIARPKGMTL